MTTPHIALSEEEIRHLIEDADDVLAMEHVITTGADLAEDILSHRETRGAPMPWTKCDGKFELRPGEVTIWAGESGSGKSLVVGQVASTLLAESARVLIASMEMHPRETVKRMCCQAAGCIPSSRFVRDFCAWAAGKLYIYDRMATVTPEHIIAMTRAVADQLGVGHVVIDSLVKCGVPDDGPGCLTAQKNFVDSLQTVAKALGIHIHLVAHTRKPENGSATGKHDVRGASQITDLADNVAMIERNRAKESAASRLDAGLSLSIKDQELLSAPDSFLHIRKQRHHAWEGTFGLDYHRPSMQLVPAGAKFAMAWPGMGRGLPWG